MKTAKPKNVDDYIASFPEQVGKRLKKIREAVKKNAPEALELLSYNMPAYKYHGMLLYFAAFERHIGFYAFPTGNYAFKSELSMYKTGKGSVQFPLDKPLPLTLINRMIKFRVKENQEKALTKKNKKE